MQKVPRRDEMHGILHVKLARFLPPHARRLPLHVNLPRFLPPEARRLLLHVKQANCDYDMQKTRVFTATIGILTCGFNTRVSSTCKFVRGAILYRRNRSGIACEKQAMSNMTCKRCQEEMKCLEFCM